MQSGLTWRPWLRARVHCQLGSVWSWRVGSFVSPRVTEPGSYRTAQKGDLPWLCSLSLFLSQGKRSLSCRPPMVKLVCPADNPRAQGLECAKTCQNYDLECMSLGCVSGCLCPPGMVSQTAWVKEHLPIHFFACRCCAAREEETGLGMRGRFNH